MAELALGVGGLPMGRQSARERYRDILQSSDADDSDRSGRRSIPLQPRSLQARLPLKHANETSQTSSKKKSAAGTSYTISEDCTDERTVLQRRLCVLEVKARCSGRARPGFPHSSSIKNSHHSNQMPLDDYYDYDPDLYKGSPRMEHINLDLGPPPRPKFAAPRHVEHQRGEAVLIKHLDVPGTRPGISIDEGPSNFAVGSTASFQTKRSSRSRLPTTHVLHSSVPEFQDGFYGEPNGTIPNNSAYIGISAGSNPPRTNSRPSSYNGAGSRTPASSEAWHTIHQNQRPQPHPLARAAPAPAPRPANDDDEEEEDDDFRLTIEYPNNPSNAGSGGPSSYGTSPLARPPPSLPMQLPFESLTNDYFSPGAFVPSLSVSRREVEARRQVPPPLELSPPSRQFNHYSSGDEVHEVAYNAMYRGNGPYQSTSYASTDSNTPPRQNNKISVAYGAAGHQIEPATTTGRRHAYHSPSTKTLDHEQLKRILMAPRYQGVSHQAPLTEEMLNQVARSKRSSDKSSRSSLNSASHDEVEWGYTGNTTHTPRSNERPNSTSPYDSERLAERRHTDTSSTYSSSGGYVPSKIRTAQSYTLGDIQYGVSGQQESAPASFSEDRKNKGTEIPQSPRYTSNGYYATEPRRIHLTSPR